MGLRLRPSLAQPRPDQLSPWRNNCSHSSFNNNDDNNNNFLDKKNFSLLRDTSKYASMMAGLTTATMFAVAKTTLSFSSFESNFFGHHFHLRNPNNFFLVSKTSPHHRCNFSVTARFGSGDGRGGPRFDSRRSRRSDFDDEQAFDMDGIRCFSLFTVKLLRVYWDRGVIWSGCLSGIGQLLWDLSMHSRIWLVLVWLLMHFLFGCWESDK